MSRRTQDQRKRQRNRLYNEQCGLCCYCGRKMRPFGTYEPGKIPGDAATVEHLDNKESGRRGQFMHADVLRKAVACAKCNNKRGNREWKLLDCWDFWRISGEWPDELPLIGLA